MKHFRLLLGLVISSAIILGACAPLPAGAVPNPSEGEPVANELQADLPVPEVTPYPTRPAYGPGELVDYTAQTGDNLPALAVHFNTTVEEIRQANPIIPQDATTMPPGMPMKIPIYYLPFWGTPYQIIPDSYFVNGPAQTGFDTQAFIDSQHGWLKYRSEYAADKNRSAADVIDYVALNFSVSPRLLLALLEFQSGALSQPAPPEDKSVYPLGYEDAYHRGLYLQLVWAANALNNGYYGWRLGTITTMELANGRMERPDPWQNAATVALQALFIKIVPADAYTFAISDQGLAATYRAYFGDPWQDPQPHIPGSLVQPAFQLPFEPNKIWAYTGGPHTGWGNGAPYSAIDFAPPSVVGGCTETDEWATATAGGVIVRSENAIVTLDLDGDGNERTGWTVFYLHVGTEGRVRAGSVLEAGDRIGHPSCEGGTSTGTHIHIARKYNGEWIPADGTLAFNLEGWVAANGRAAYYGTLNRFTQTVTANSSSDSKSFIQSEVQP